MALLTELSPDSARQLLRPYAIELADLEPLAAGSVNSNFAIRDSAGRRWFARLYEEQSLDGARAEVRLLSELADCGVPVALPVAAAGGEPVAEHDGKPFAVFHWVEGEWLCLKRVTPAACRAVGDALAQVHLSTDRLTPISGGRFRVEDIAARLDHIEADANDELIAAARTIRQSLQRYAALRSAELPTGVIHGDLFRDNTLFGANGSISALLDFESASTGPFVFDLMVTLLAWCFRDRLEPELAGALLGAYNARRPLLAMEREQLGVEGALACLRFATTRITDFSMRTAPGATPARDYRRFLARLRALEAGALKPLIAGLPSEA